MCIRDRLAPALPAASCAYLPSPGGGCCPTGPPAAPRGGSLPLDHPWTLRHWRRWFGARGG
eukprot:5336265-Alexandrium_andersonii.AAC.1